MTVTDLNSYAGGYRFRGAFGFFGFAAGSLAVTRPISPNDTLKISRWAASQ
jgi:hypothetical protein